jgi:restriction endonuclease S subunit
MCDMKKNWEVKKLGDICEIIENIEGYVDSDFLK